MKKRGIGKKTQFWVCMSLIVNYLKIVNEIKPINKRLVLSEKFQLLKKNLLSEQCFYGFEYLLVHCISPIPKNPFRHVHILLSIHSALVAQNLSPHFSEDGTNGNGKYDIRFNKKKWNKFFTEITYKAKFSKLIRSCVYLSSHMKCWSDMLFFNIFKNFTYSKICYQDCNKVML